MKSKLNLLCLFIIYINYILTEEEKKPKAEFIEDMTDFPYFRYMDYSSRYYLDLVAY